MKILNLGRILSLCLFPIIVFANVKASLDKIAVLEGEPVTLSISASGNNIDFPQLRTVEGFKVLRTSQSSSIQIINGSMTRNKTISYQFIPKYSFRVPIYSVIIDGKEFNTQELRLKVIKPSASKNGDDLYLELQLSQNEAYVGEAIITSIFFKYKVGMPLVDASLEDFAPKHFWIKQLKASEPYEENGYITIRQDFITSPQLAGNYTIEKQIIEVAKREYGTNMIRRQKVFSNSKKLKVLALPPGIDIQGDFKISASLDKNSTKANEPVNLTIKIEGLGNIDDIDELKFDLENEVVYSSKPEISSYLKNKKYGGVFEQKVSIIADKDYTIPSIEFKFFNKATKSIKTIKTKEFDVKVSGIKTTNPNIQTSKVQVNKAIQVPAKIIYKSEDSYIKYVFMLIGIFIGILISYFIFKPKNKQKQDKPLEIQIKKAKNDKALYTVLLPYSFNTKIISIIKQLEENIYNNKSNKINKKELLNLVYEEKLESARV